MTQISTSTENEFIFDDIDYSSLSCKSTSFDSVCQAEDKKASFEGWFDDDKLVKIKVDGKIIDFSEKKNMFNVIDNAVSKLVDFKYKFS